MGPGCNNCLPYAFDFQVINGRSYCKHCGRVITDQLELYVVSSRTVSPAPRRPNNSWERGIRRDERGLPYLDSNGVPLRLKESFDPRKYGEGPIEVQSTGR